jgi:outer membrane lipoprotein
MKNRLFILISIFVSAVLISCAAGISQEARSMISFTGSFKQVQQQPSQFEGEVVMWGGKVIETQAANGATELIVLQFERDNSNRPQVSGMSGGRFLVRSDQFLDPAVFSPGTLITVVGKVIGSTVMPIGQMKYRYPVLEPVELKKWDDQRYSSPRIHFGIGVGTHF